MDEAHLREAARSFLSAALDALRAEHVVPTSRYQPFLRVGHDYVGTTVTGDECAAFEQAIAASHPRFSDDAPDRERDFAHIYLFSFLQAFIAEVALNREAWSPDAPSFDRCLDSLVAAIEAETLSSPFGRAKHRFLTSYHAYAWHEQIVDLAIAFEAALSGTDKSDVSLRLKSRAAACWRRKTTQPKRYSTTSGFCIGCGLG